MKFFFSSFEFFLFFFCDKKLSSFIISFFLFHFPKVSAPLSLHARRENKKKVAFLWVSKGKKKKK